MKNNYNTENTNLITDSSIEYSLDFDQLESLEKLPKQRYDTGGSQGFVNRLAIAFRNVYENYKPISDPQRFLIIGALLGSSLTLQNFQPDYRIDKSPTTTINNNILDWYQIETEDFRESTDITQQPKYSYNKIYRLAKRIGFPTEFEL